MAARLPVELHDSCHFGQIDSLRVAVPGVPLD
jgi:hypothetical protein